ncbi:hypothetical protein QCA50_002674 [Cerrena zonata]|uniref:DUF6534 domain-containing protein n=1 Tax=Cerrena zonata TaxID=2478898 RepID=A0AAW0GSD9_9APHY
MVYYCRLGPIGLQTNRSSKLDYALNSLMTYSIHSGLITSAVSLGVAVTYACLKDNLVYVGLAAIVSKLYSNSLLGMLNARIHLRSMVYDGPAVNVNEALSESSDSAAV